MVNDDYDDNDDDRDYHININGDDDIEDDDYDHRPELVEPTPAAVPCTHPPSRFRFDNVLVYIFTFVLLNSN